MTRTILELGLFAGADQRENFAHLNTMLPAREMRPAPHPEPWPTGHPLALPDTFAGVDGEVNTREFLTRTGTSALLVLRDGAVRHEQYWDHGGPDVPWLSMSVSKSFVSALVGCLVAEGKIRSIDDAISAYITVAPGSAYDGVSIVHVLGMSSGARWNEDYSSLESDIVGLMLATAGQAGTLDEFIGNMVREFEPGTVCRYNSADTQALGMLIRAASGTTVSEYMQRTLVDPLGFTDPGYWLLDSTGQEVVFGSLNLTARDYARLGELFRNGGVHHGTQVVPAAWVHDSTHVTMSQCAAVDLSDRHDPVGYGYQWWLPGGDDVFCGIGVYNQFVYVDPVSRTTIVKLSANPSYGLSDTEADNCEADNLALLRTLAAAAAQ